MKKSLILFFILIGAIPLFSQKELYVSQYMHSRYTVNSAFAGSAEALSVFASYRKQWTGLNGAPSAQFFSAHTPLKNDRIALGVEFYGQQYAMSHNTGFTASYTYRIRPTERTQLGLSVNAGMSLNKAGWNEVSVKQSNDPAFVNAVSRSMPVVGLGAAWYGSKFFSGVSVSNLFYNNLLTSDESEFNPAEAHCIVTGGYMFQKSRQFGVQPSVLLNYSKEDGVVIDAGLNVLLGQIVWIGGSYRTSEDVVAMAGIQVMSPLRIIYSWDKSMNDMSGLNSGSHEISIRYEFGIRLPAVNARFF